MNYGSKIWIFPDAECPPEGVNSIPGHESIIITNTRCLRTNSEQDFGNYTVPISEQYAIMLESDCPVIAQYGRADPRTVAFYTTPGYNTN